MNILRPLFIAVPIGLCAVYGIDIYMNMPVVDRPAPQREASHAAALRVLDAWPTDPGIYEDAYLLASYVEAGYDERPVEADWIRERFGTPTQRVNGEQWNLPTGRASLYVKIEPDGDVVVWQRALILDNPTRGELFRAMRAGGVEDYRGIEESQ